LTNFGVRLRIGQLERRPIREIAMTQLAGILTFTMIALGLATAFSTQTPAPERTESIVVLAED